MAFSESTLSLRPPPALTGQEKSPAGARPRSQHGRKRLSFLFLSVAIPLCLSGAVPAEALGSHRPGPLPWSLRLDLHWGAKKNREAYREAFSRALVERIVEEECFRTVSDHGPSDLVLDLSINDLSTEQEYSTVTGMLPGQGEEHHLIAAHASVNLDFALVPEGRGELRILDGHVYREVTREPTGPGDAAVSRALSELLRDATHWVTRQLCEQREKLSKKIAQGLATPHEAPQPPQEPQAASP